MKTTKKPYWELSDLVTIGIFAAIAKVSSFLVALVGGGPNPITLMLKNLVFTTLVVVLLYKVRKFGSLTLFLVVGALISSLLTGGNLGLAIPMALAGLLSESIIMLLGGYDKSLNLMIGVGLNDILFKISSLGVSWFYVREQPETLIVTAIFVAIGYIGAFLGLFVGAYFVKELRHACIIRE